MTAREDRVGSLNFLGFGDLISLYSEQLDLFLLLVVALVVGHQVLELLEVREARQHVQKLLVDLLRPAFQQLEKPLHVQVSDGTGELLHIGMAYLREIGFYFHLILLEHGHVLRLVFLGAVEDIDVLLNEAALHLFERLGDDDVLHGAYNAIEVGIIGVAPFIVVGLTVIANFKFVFLKVEVFLGLHFQIEIDTLQSEPLKQIFVLSHPRRPIPRQPNSFFRR